MDLVQVHKGGQRQKQQQQHCVERIATDWVVATKGSRFDLDNGGEINLKESVRHSKEHSVLLTCHRKWMMQSVCFSTSWLIVRTVDQNVF